MNWKKPYTDWFSKGCELYVNFYEILHSTKQTLVYNALA